MTEKQKHECDCGRVFYDLEALYACQASNHGSSNYWKARAEKAEAANLALCDYAEGLANQYGHRMHDPGDPSNPLHFCDCIVCGNRRAALKEQDNG